MPTGGPIDATPPKLDTLRSSPLIQTQFTGNSLEFVFDEFIVINNALKELIISPPLQHPPELIAKRRIAVLKLNNKDTLRANTTYSIQFNDAIQDFTEGNKVKNLVAVFSTGKLIDSAELVVQVIDNETSIAAPDVHVMLYRNLEDSVVYREKPYYASRTNTSGIAHLKYLHPGEYKIFALKDENMNMFYDIPTEKIGFLPTTIHVPSDSAILNIRVFEADRPTSVLDSDCKPSGKCIFTFNNPPRDEYAISSLNPEHIVSAYANTDSFIVWRAPHLHGNIHFLLDSSGIVKDTIKTKTRVIDSLKYSKRAYFSKKTPTITVNPVHGAEIYSIRPIKTLHQDSIMLIDTSGKQWTHEITRDTINSTTLHYSSSKAGNYTLRFLPGSLEDYYGYTLRDTVDIDIVVKESSELSKLIIDVQDLDSTTQYILQLELKGKPLREEIIYGQTSQQYEYSGMEANKYAIKLIKDDNKNKKHDKGSYRTKQQPESIVIKEIEGMRAGWDFQESISPN